MSQFIEVKVPDIGDYKDVPVIEVHVKPGDIVSKEQSLITLESDKATMDVPSSHDGVVKEVKVKVGDSISEGAVVLLLESASKTETSAANKSSPAATPVASSPNAVGQAISVAVPDIGDYKNVPVIEVHVKPGDVVTKEQSLVTLESDKATMDVPSSHDGVVKEVKVKVGDVVSQGDLVLVLEASGQSSVAKSAEQAPAVSTAPVAETATKTNAIASAPTAPTAVVSASGVSHASPSVRKFARELGVDEGRLVLGRIPKGGLDCFFDCV